MSSSVKSQPPAASAGAPSPIPMASLPSRSQSIPAPNTSTWTRLDDGNHRVCHLSTILKESWDFGVSYCLSFL